jgi:hypothetical protein
MSGLIAMALVLVWLVLVSLAVYRLTRRINNGVLRVGAGLLAVGMLLPLPLVDELLGRPQFERLCRENTAIHMDRIAVAGKSVFFQPQPRVEVKGTWLRTFIQPHRFIDSSTGEVAIAYAEVVTSGGVLSRGLTEGGVPFTFKGSCMPDANIPVLFKSLGISVRDLPSASKRETK